MVIWGFLCIFIEVGIELFLRKYNFEAVQSRIFVLPLHSLAAMPAMEIFEVIKLLNDDEQ